MLSYTTKNINIISLIISIILFISVNQVIGSIDFYKYIPNKKIEEVAEKINSIDLEKNITVAEDKDTTNTYQTNNWKIEIPVISLSAEISEGTTTDVMNKYVGHFTNTSKADGNIGLAAHNRGYPVNYFQNIKKLKRGDEIYYQYDNYKKIYIVDKILIIGDTDWSKLEQSEDNIITLITCVENEPLYRRCIQATEK